MAELTVSEEIAASPDLVFALATDLAGAAERITGIDAIEVLTEGDFGVGTRWRETRTMMGRSATEEMAVSEFEPGRSYTATAESNGCRYHSGVRVEPSATGARITFHFRGEPTSTTSRVMMTLMSPLSWIMTGQVRKLIEADLADIRRAAEAEASGESNG